MGHDASMTSRMRRLPSAVLALGLVLAPLAACSQNQNDQQQNQNDQNQNDQNQNQNQNDQNQNDQQQNQ